MRNCRHSSFLLICSVCLLLVRTPQGLNLAPTEIVAIEGDPFDILCPAPGAACQVDVPGLNSSISLPLKEAAGHSWTQLGCGVRLEAARRRHAGLVNCTSGGVTTHVQIRVVWPPDKVQMLASNKYFEFTDGRDMNFTCTALGGSPPDNVSIYLDDELMKSSSTEPSVSWGRPAEAADHMKRIKCLVVHPALRTNTFQFSRSLDVKFAPKLVSKQAASVAPGGNATLRVVAKANPLVKQAEWSCNGTILDSERFSAWNNTNLTKGSATIWTCSLDVVGVTEEDFSCQYELKLSNQVGSRTFQLHLRQQQQGRWGYNIAIIVVVALAVPILAYCVYHRVKKSRRCRVPEEQIDPSGENKEEEDDKYNPTNTAFSTPKLVVKSSTLLTMSIPLISFISSSNYFSRELH